MAQSWGRRISAPGDEVLVTWMEHHSNIVPWQLVCEQTGATLKVCPDHRSRRAGPRRLRSPADAADEAGRDDPREQRARHDQPGRRARAARRKAAGAVVLVDGAQAVAAPAGRRAGDRLRLLRLLRPQDVRARRAPACSTEGGAARRDAAVPGRRRHDRVGHLREDRLQRAAVQVRGRHAEHRRRRRPRRGASTTSRRSTAQAARAHEDALLAYATARVRSVPGVRILGEARAEVERAVVRDRRRAPARHRHDPRHRGHRRAHRASTARSR